MARDRSRQFGYRPHHAAHAAARGLPAARSFSAPKDDLKTSMKTSPVDCTRTINRLRSVLTQIYPSLEHVFAGERLRRTLSLDLFIHYKRALKASSEPCYTRVHGWLVNHVKKDPTALCDETFAALKAQTVTVPGSSAASTACHPASREYNRKRAQGKRYNAAIIRLTRRQCRRHLRPAAQQRILTKNPRPRTYRRINPPHVKVWKYECDGQPRVQFERQNG